MTTDQKMAPRLKKSGYHHGDLRAGLIEATRHLVEEHGPDGFSVSDACRLAGVSTAAPYKHFKDKTEMIKAMVMEGMMRHKTHMMAALEPHPPGTPERVMALGREYVRFALEEPQVFRLKFGGFTDRITDEELQAMGEGTFGIVLREVAACLGEDEVTQDVRSRAFILWNFVHGLSFIMGDDDLSKMRGDVDVDTLLARVALAVLA